jgi:hypothetical protein
VPIFPNYTPQIVTPVGGGMSPIQDMPGSNWTPGDGAQTVYNNMGNSPAPGATPGMQAGQSSYYYPQSQWEGAGMTPNI